MIFPRREAQDDYSRRNIDKRIYKLIRKELRFWKTKWTEYLLEKIETTKYIQKIQDAPRQTSICPIESVSFATFLGNLFTSSNPLNTNDLDKIQFRRIPKFQFEELNIISQEIANLKDVDEDDIKENMISIFNQTNLLKIHGMSQSYRYAKRFGS